jgi:hypothetical protein
MDPLSDNHLVVWLAVDDALNTFPMETPPPDLTTSIMRTLPDRSISQFQPQVKMRFQIFSWFDVVISMFLSMMFGFVLLLMAGWFIPPQMIPALGWLLQIISYPTVAIPLLIASVFTLVFLALTARLLLTSHRRFARII